MSGQTPAPVTTTSYNLAGSSSVRHALLGVVPNGRYSVTLNNGVVSVAQSAAGDKIACMNEVAAFADQIAKLRVELLRRHGEAVRAAGIDLVIAQNAQRWPPEGKMREAR